MDMRIMSKKPIQRKYKCQYCGDYATSKRVKADIRVIIDGKLLDDYVGLVDEGCGLIAKRYGFLKRSLRNNKQNYD